MTKEELLSLPVSWIAGTTSKAVEHPLLGRALADIRDGKQKEKVLRMREVVELDHDRYDAIKGTLPANIFSGRFVGGHGAVNNVEYNRLLTLDIDKLDAEQLVKVRQDLEEDEHVFAFWLSPSGKGYKGLVPLDYGDADIEDKVYWHREAFKQLEKYFGEKYGIELDIHCKDVPRLCFVSYDPNIMVKDEVSPFRVEPIEEVVKAKKESEKHRKAFINYQGANYKRNVPGRNQQKDRDTVASIVKYLEKRKVSITQSYSDWFSVAMAIVTTFNYDLGEKYYLRLCRLDGARHNEGESISMLRYCYEHSNFEITLGTLIYLAQRKGYKSSIKAVPKRDTDSDE